jgi:hypothetical protein
MKKKILNVRNIADNSKFERKIKNAFSDEGREAADAIIEFIRSLEEREEEVSPEEIYGLVEEFIDAKVDERVAKEVANAVSKRMAEIQNATKKELPAKVKNQIAMACLNSSKDQIKNEVEKVLVNNGITGLSFSDVIDFAVVDKWGASNRFFDALKKVPFTKFFYTSQDLSDANILAKGWKKTNEGEKAVQNLTLNGKSINTQYVYKRLPVALEDLDDINASGTAATFFEWVNEELDRQIANTIVMAILTGDAVNSENNRVTSFEAIGSKVATDLFTTVLNPEAGDVTLGDLRRMRASIHNPNGYPVTLCISRSLLDEVSKFVYATGGTEDYRTLDEIKNKIGVEELFITDLLPAEGNVQAVMLIAEEYWVKEKNAISVAFAKYDNNTQMYQKERNIGGGIHGARSTAVLRTA